MITLNDLPKPVELNWIEFSFRVLDAAASSGRMILIDLTHILGVTDVLNGGGPFAQTITAQELRYIRENWSRFAPVVEFYEQGVRRVPPWE